MKAWELLSDKSKWCQGVYALTKDGATVLGHNQDACKFCASGALQRCYEYRSCEVVARYAEALKKANAVSRAKFPTYSGVVEVNDRLGYDAVMQVLKEADV